MWSPLLTGKLAERALAKAREIAMAQAEKPTAREPDRVLYWAYTSAVFDEEFANDAYAAALDDLVASLRRGTPHLGLFGGLANAGWVICHVMEADDTEDALTAIDDALLGVMRADEWRGAHDLIEGLVGFGMYFLERIDHGADKARDGLARVVTHLDRTATRTDDGLTWHTPLAILGPTFADEYPDGFFDCGIAHGVPGMIAMLARAAAHIDEARPLALEARRWLESLHIDVDGDRRFPAKIAGAIPTKERAEDARTAWCYGDPGVALALWWADHALGATHIDDANASDATRANASDAARANASDAVRASAATRASALALASMSRSVTDARVKDATLCHGAAGLGHMCNRFFQATGDHAFADQARTWLERAIEMPMLDEPAFLDGSGGVGLALVAAATASEPAWDRLLLSDLTSR